MSGVVFSRNQIGIKPTGQSVTVPNDPKAKLMYYLDCVCHVLPLDEDGSLSRLRKYNNYASLSTEDYAKLLTACLLVPPNLLEGEVFFHAPELCGDSSNKFYELSAVNTQLALTDSIIIGGVRRKVKEIMVFEGTWLENNFIEPLKSFKKELERYQYADNDDCCCCIIL